MFFWGKRYKFPSQKLIKEAQASFESFLHRLQILTWLILQRTTVARQQIIWNICNFQYLTKQTSSLREVNDSRVKIYEQLEVSISELEATNKKLIDENSVDKGKIKRYKFIID